MPQVDKDGIGEKDPDMEQLVEGETTVLKGWMLAVRERDGGVPVCRTLGQAGDSRQICV